MLIRTSVLQRVKSGEVTLAFRRWRRPTVKNGGTLKTAVGLLAVPSVERVGAHSITARDARAAGYSGRTELLEALGDREGEIYRIRLAYAGPDPRVQLRESDMLSEAETVALRARLARLDRASRVGPWTVTVLSAIQRHPHVAARVLADTVGQEKDWLKVNVRKLKNLGLTESHHPGYTLSPRGRKVLAELKRRPST